MKTLAELVADLPERYQPIFRHPELSDMVSRRSVDRVATIVDVCTALQRDLGRRIRVLDLGCAQGYVSMSLAEQGAVVHGVDYLEQNVRVCNALSDEFPDLEVSFELGRIEETIGAVENGQYDVVLGLSLFHHLIHGVGAQSIQMLIGVLAKAIPIGLYELALQSEPMEWAPSQPADPRDLLVDYPFVRLLDRFPTHLSDVVRPLYLCGADHWYVDGKFGRFDAAWTEPHAFAQGVHGRTRRYFFGQGAMLKQFRRERPDGLDVNVVEIERERSFLAGDPRLSDAPSLLAYESNDEEIFLLRELIDGELLSTAIDSKRDFDRGRVVAGVLDRLVELEERSLYHTDLRPWNILISAGDVVHLIDYGAIDSRPVDCSWPYNIYLSFVVLAREVFGGVVARPAPVRPALLDTVSLPDPYRSAFREFFRLPSSKWSFAALRAMIDAQPGEPERNLVDEVMGQLENLSKISNAEIEARNRVADEARARLEEAFARINATEHRAIDAEARAERAVEALELERAALASAAEDRKRLEEELARARSDATASRERAEKAEAFAAGAEHRASRAAERIAQGEARIAELRERLERLEAELGVLKRNPIRASLSRIFRSTTPS